MPTVGSTGNHTTEATLLPCPTACLIQNLLNSEKVWHGSTSVRSKIFVAHAASATRHLPLRLQNAPDTRTRNFLPTQLNHIARAVKPFELCMCTGKPSTLHDSTGMEVALPGDMLSGQDSSPVASLASDRTGETSVVTGHRDK